MHAPTGRNQRSGAWTVDTSDIELTDEGLGSASRLLWALAENELLEKSESMTLARAAHLLERLKDEGWV